MQTILIVLLPIVLFLSSCATKTISIEKKFKADKVIVHIDAKKTSLMSPWNIRLRAKIYSFSEGELSFEQQVSDLTEEKISFDWIDDNTCIIGFPDNVNHVRKFKLFATPENYSLMEIVE